MPKKGVTPPWLRKFLFKKGEKRGSAPKRAKRRSGRVPKKGKGGGSRKNSMMKFVKPLVLGLLGGTTATGITGNQLAGAAGGAATQYGVGGDKSGMALVVAAVAGYFGHSVALKAQSALSGQSSGSPMGNTNW